jgi:CheY-like chemotaxis protein
MCHVLIIEDDMIAALDIRETLERAGATSFSFAATEREAIECARAARPAFVTADVMLGSTSGVAALRLIEAELGPLPAIFITGTPDQCEATNHPVLEKPFHPARLAEMFIAAAPL